MWSTIFLVILAIVGAVSLVTAVKLVRRGRISTRDASLGLVGLVLVPFVAGLLWLAGSNGDQREGYCQVEVNITGGLGKSGFSADRQGGATTGETELQRNKQGQPSYTVRQKCVQGSSQIGSLPVFVTILTFFAILSIGLLTHATATGERDTARARIVIDLPNVTSGMVRLVNVGSSPGFVIGLGTYKEGKAVARNRWTGLNRMSRLVPPGEDSAVEIPLDLGPLAEDASLVVLVRYRDGYGAKWEAWRVFKMTAAQTVAVEEDGERRSRG